MQKKKIDRIPILSDNMQKILYSYSKSRSLPASLVKRSNIILFSAKGMTDREISFNLDIHYNNVATWRTRFLEKLSFLQDIETSNPEKLEEEIRTLLSDKKRSGAPPTFTSEQITKIIDLACKDPSDFGYEVSQWSLPLLVKQIKIEGIAKQISAKSVSRFLKIRQIYAPIKYATGYIPQKNQRIQNPLHKK